MTDHDATGEARRSWDGVSAGWETNRDRMFAAFRHVSEWLVDQTDPRPGDTVLEVAAGVGDTGFLAAERVGPTGRLISTDIAPGMVEAASRAAEAAGLTDVECRVMDAQALDLPDASVDVVLSRLGLMFAPDLGAVFTESHRVLSPGGRLAYAVIGAPDRNPWMSLLVGAFVGRGHVLMSGNPFGPGGPFSLSEPARNEELLRAAAFDEVEVHDLIGAFSFRDADDQWQLHLAIAGPIADLAATLDADELAAVKADLAVAMEPFRSGDGYALPSHLVGVIAR
ncbi:MAG: methyltransferase domain-containing protein [Acidimicrobiales bacterium]|nr:methyltransferase domain-containing protein [Acidimicrobiales bacterium]